MKQRKLKRARADFAACVQHKQPWTWEDRMKYLKNRIRELKPGTMIETCGLDIARIVYVDGDELCYDHVAGRYPGGGHGYCSVLNCGPVILNPVALKKRMDIFKKDGARGLALRYYREDCKMTEEQIADRMGEWHSDK